MGGGSSKSALYDKGGVVDLGEKENKVIATLDSLFDQLLRSTNPINFKQAMDATGKQSCSGILVILQPMIEKEFQKAAFQDPASKQIVQAIFKGYDTVEDLSKTLLTKTLCKEITLFFLRLIVLVGTCVVSIRPNRAMTSLLGTIGSSFVEETDQLQGIVKIKMETIAPKEEKPEESARKGDKPEQAQQRTQFGELRKDKKDNELKEILKRILEADANGPKEIVKKKIRDYYIISYNAKEYVIDLQHLFVYRNEQDTTQKVGLLELSTTTIDPLAPPAEVKRGGTRRASRDGRQTRRAVRAVRAAQQGGGDDEISTLESERKGERGMYYYMFNRTTELCNKTKDKPSRTTCDPSGEKTISTSDSLSKFVGDVFAYYVKIFDGSGLSKERIEKYGAPIEGLGSSKSTAEGYAPLDLDDDKTYARLEKLLADTGDVRKLEEGTCLAVYRAYLLASGVIKTDSGKELKTYVCHDKWATKQTALRDIPLFALLDQLYKDRDGKHMEPDTKNKYELFVDRLRDIGTVKPINSPDDKTIDNLQFAPPSDESSLCKGGRTGLDTIPDLTTIESVMSEYSSIANQLVTLIDKITKVIDKILDFKLFIDEKRIKLRSVFMTDKRGAQAVLTEYIELVRHELEEHILSVEQSYADGVKVLTGSTHADLLVDRTAGSSVLASSLAV
jgi:hypothetical protein